MTAPNPDPLVVDDYAMHQVAEEQAAWDDGYERGIRDSFPPLIALLLVGIVAAIVGGMIGWSFAQFTAPRSAATAIPTAASDTPSARETAASGNPSLPSEASRLAMRDASFHAGGGVHFPPPASALSSSGVASWCAPTPTKCRRWAPPALLAAVPSFTYGDRRYLAKVCRADDRARCVTVTVVSYCACGSRVIDLSPAAFAKLAKLSAGLVRVTVSGRVLALPATDR